MKQIKKLILIILIPLSLLYSCSGNGNGNSISPKDSTSFSTKNSSANSTGDANFSCKIDGKDFSGQGSEQLRKYCYTYQSGCYKFCVGADGECSTRNTHAIQFFCSRSWHHNDA